MSVTFFPSLLVPIVGFLGPILLVGSFLYFADREEIK